jgi:hypothetical protein
MAVQYKIDTDINLIYYACFGPCTGSEVLQLERSAFQDPLRRPRAKIILDIQRAEMDISIKDIHDVIALNKKLKSEGVELEKTAVITKSSYLEVFANMFRLMADELPLNLGVFYTTQDAVSWLGIPDSIEKVLEIQKSIEGI